MGLLRILRLGLIAAWRGWYIARAIIGLDHTAYGTDCLIDNLHAVGPHIGDQADRLAADIDAFVEPLRYPHGVRWGETELAACLLLERRGGEWRLRMALDRLGFNRSNRERGRLQRALEGFRLGARADVETLQLFAIGADQARVERLVARCRQRGHDRPVFLANKPLDFQFTIADEPQRHRLHAAGRAGAGQFAPQHRRQRKTNEVIERAARQIGVDQRLVDLAGLPHRLRHRLLGDGVEHDALNGLAVERLFLLQKFEDVPGDRFAFAIGVGRQDEFVGALDRTRDIVEPLGRLGIDLPEHAKIVIRVHRAALGRQVADMAERGQDLVALAQIFVDRFRLGGRFYQYEVHSNPLI